MGPGRLVEAAPHCPLTGCAFTYFDYKCALKQYGCSARESSPLGDALGKGVAPAGGIAARRRGGLGAALSAPSR